MTSWGLEVFQITSRHSWPLAIDFGVVLVEKQGVLLSFPKT
jgi:hypothetical protein